MYELFRSIKQKLTIVSEVDLITYELIYLLCSTTNSKTNNEHCCIGVKSEEFAAEQVSETYIAHKDSLTVCGKASPYEKPKDSNIAMVSSILNEYVDLYISENVDMNIIGTEGEEEISVKTKKKISKTLTIHDDKYSDSSASVSFDLAQLFEGEGEKYFQNSKFKLQ